MGKLFGEEWRALTPDEKKEYDVLAKDDKERYDTEFTQVRRTDHSHRLKRHLLFVCGIPVNYRRRGWRHRFARGRALACNFDWCACACAVCCVPCACEVEDGQAKRVRGDAEAEGGGEHGQAQAVQGDGGELCCIHSDKVVVLLHWTHDARPCVKTTTNIRVNAAVNDCLLYRPLDLRPALAR